MLAGKTPTRDMLDRQFDYGLVRLFAGIAFGIL